MINIAIFVSGSGTNCENLIRYFKDSERVNCALVVSNKADAYGLVRAERLGVATAITPKAELNDINIHPALLPKYGGKGMWGHHVHEAVKAAGEKETGMTVHYVTPVCDSGEIIAQFRVALSPDDTADDIAAKEHLLEMEHFPQIVEQVIDEAF